ncbi:DUF3619 family protein [Sulfurirhabdus autotrophica]|uniref:Uncharacterized protein DUF3619 n=1 Tax=Sulfurirhabdus autotrophica TaxID=1706046 RepID=A0A4R3YB16_9PROT|nr:DUF3619 family protein [Sulfurirhabdus autotrophica]TCV89120.1 uncharacterized protein DUF3619 [Sulfurirhabdus autotrophica]
MNEHDLAKKIARQLNYGTTNLSENITTQLKASRMAALDKYSAHQPAMSLVGASHSLLNQGKNWLSHHRLLIPVTVLILGLAAITYWQSTQQDNDTGEIDASLLADDLPIHAYVDNRLDTWVKSSSEQ